MECKVFNNDDQGYYNWLDSNANGFVLNYNPTHKNMRSLHKAWCGKIGFKKNSEKKSATAGEVNKLCALSLDNIDIWMGTNWGEPISFAMECSCMAKNKPTEIANSNLTVRARNDRSYALDVAKYINKFMANKVQIDRNERSASFDFCYGYFRSFKDENKLMELASSENMQLSCLQLGFYLASWGMYRGQYLRNHSYTIFEPVIKLISKTSDLWQIDLDSYTKENIDKIVAFQYKLNDALTKHWKHPHIIESKIMLGVFGCVPAFDTLVINASYINGFKKSDLIHCKGYYETNKAAFDAVSIPIIDNSGSATGLNYTKAKLLDMVLNTMGDEMQKKK